MSSWPSWWSTSRWGTGYTGARSCVIHWVDNSGAVAASVNGYASAIDTSRIVRAMHATIAAMHIIPWFEYVRTKGEHRRRAVARRSGRRAVRFSQRRARVGRGGAQCAGDHIDVRRFAVGEQGGLMGSRRRAGGAGGRIVVGGRSAMRALRARGSVRVPAPTGVQDGGSMLALTPSPGEGAADERLGLPWRQMGLVLRAFRRNGSGTAEGRRPLATLVVYT